MAESSVPHVCKQEAQQEILLQLAKMQNNTALSDFTISCDGQEWKVHRVVLSLHSSVLAKACDASFKEASDRHIDLRGDDPAAISALVHYLYHLDYEPRISEAVECESSALCLHVRVCVVADKYDIQPLKNLAIANFGLMVDKKPSTPALIEAALLAYETPQVTRSMCSAIIEYVLQEDLLSPTVQGIEEVPSGFAQAMERCNELAANIAMALHRQQHKSQRVIVHEREQRYYCPGFDCFHSQIMDISSQDESGFACYYCELGYTFDELNTAYGK